MLEDIQGDPGFNELMEISRGRHEQFKRAFF
jgi:hypothetical protein